ncbi:hypothetical protein [Aquabacterium sp.]|uniref:hypothetical protein n=1 Tax=Aquabacterium sp. TaxID=1872578 RepID=UPI0037838165
MNRHREDPQRDDLDDWLQALAGRPAAHATAATRREAQWLREAMQRWPTPTATPLPPEAEAAWQARLEETWHARAVQAGLLPAEGSTAPHRGQRPWWRRACAGCAARGERLRAWFGSRPAAAGLALAAVALLVVGLLQLQPPAVPPGAPPLLRGAQHDGSWLLQAADAPGLRDEWASRLEATGASVRRYQRLGRFGLEAEWPTPAPGLDARLAALGLQRGPDGSLRIEVEAAGNPQR